MNSLISGWWRGMSYGRWGVLILLGLALLVFGSLASAHGAKISYSVDVTVTLVAEFDTGEPMAHAQVMVYSPADPATPWLTGEADEEGRFSFVPDPALPGTWDVQVRAAGHGDIVHIPIGAGGAASGSTGFSPAQIVLMAASVVWGLVGTALYFSRGRGTTAHQEA
ncbi:MAG: hypothetical protein Kow0077_23640 [Anaerolineae bacterium]